MACVLDEMKSLCSLGYDHKHFIVCISMGLEGKGKAESVLAYLGHSFCSTAHTYLDFQRCVLS